MLIRFSGLPVRSPCLVASQALKCSMWWRSRSAQLATCGWCVGEPGAELAQVVLDVRHRRRPQTQRDLVDVAARDLGEAGRDGRPSADRDGRAGAGPGVGIETPGVEQRELEAVEDGGHVPAGTRRPARDERVDDGRAGLLELGRADRIRWRAGERGDLGQRRPLQHRVGAAKPEPLGERRRTRRGPQGSGGARRSPSGDRRD